MSTSTIQLDENNDLFLPDGRNLGILTDEDAVVQDVRLAGLMRLGEDPFDVTTGVDYFGTIFTPRPDYDAARLSLSNNMAASPDVVSVNELTITVNGNEFDFEADLSTLYGQLTVRNTQ